MSQKRFPKLRLMNQIGRLVWTLADYRAQYVIDSRNSRTGTLPEAYTGAAFELQQIEELLLSARRALRTFEPVS